MYVVYALCVRLKNVEDGVREVSHAGRVGESLLMFGYLGLRVPVLEGLCRVRMMMRLL